MVLHSIRVLTLLWIAVCVLNACEGIRDPWPTQKISKIDGKTMVLIPAGEFIMGTSRTDPDKTHLKIGTVKPLYLDQHPERRVYLEAYYIDQFEVTNREYKAFVESTEFPELPGHWEEGTYPEGKGDLPVTNVTWQEALAYALWAGKRLPTEAQWEKAARGTDGRLFPWGNEYRKGWANSGVDGAKSLVPGGRYPKDVSPYNVFDLGGNVMEWTLSWYQAYPGNDYQFKKFGKEFKVLRGNGFQKGGHYFLEAYRYMFYRTEARPEEYFENVGFRCVVPLTSPN